MSEDINSHLLQLLQHVGRSIQARMCDVTEVAGKLTLVQIRALDILYRKEQMTMADLAKYLGITPASATSLVDRLVLSGWLKRQHDPQDRRKIVIVIAEDKRAPWQAMERKRVDRMSVFLNALTPEQKQDFIHILETLNQQPESHQ